MPTNFNYVCGNMACCCTNKTNCTCISIGTHTHSQRTLANLFFRWLCQSSLWFLSLRIVFSQSNPSFEPSSLQNLNAFALPWSIYLTILFAPPFFMVSPSTLLTVLFQVPFFALWLAPFQVFIRRIHLESELPLSCMSSWVPSPQPQPSQLSATPTLPTFQACISHSLHLMSYLDVQHSPQS